jgi:class 3 adenylate cyclase
MNTAPNQATVRTVLELDLASYSDIARLLEENLDVHAVKILEDQVQSFIDVGLAQVALKREDVVIGSAGDNAILVFDDPAQMHRFAQAVQQAVLLHNGEKTVDSAKRSFRMGAATGRVLLLQEERRRRIVGGTVGRAVRLESAAEVGQILVDVATYDALPDTLKGLYGDEEVIAGKREEWFAARRCTLIPIDRP